MIKYEEDLKIFYSSIINDADFFSGFSTKDLSDGRHTQNILNFFSQNNIKVRKLITLEQIHSSNIAFFEASDDTSIIKIEETDGVITKDIQTVLTVINADCLPLVMTEKKKGLIGISHQGWKGTLKKLAVKMVDEFIKHGAEKKLIEIAMGPSIGMCCYDIDEERRVYFLEEFEKYEDKILFSRGDHYHLNLPVLNYLQLVDAGIQPKNIDYFPFCTLCDQSRFFSFRREKSKDFSRMFNFIMKKN